MGRPPKERVEEDVKDFGKDDYELFNKTNKDELKGELLEEVGVPKGHGTGSLSLDIALTQAIPQGYIYEIYADNGVGKTTLALEIEGQAQKNGCRVGYLDLEGTLNKSLVSSIRTLNTNLKDDKGQPMWIYKEGLIRDKETGEVKPITGEQALRYAKNFMGMFKNSYLVVDSVDSLVPEAILEGKELGENTMGQLGKLLSDAMRRLHGICKMNNSTLIFINQIRTNPGIMFGNPETTPGGKALAFYCFQRLRLSKAGASALIKNDDGTTIGHVVDVKIIKNKVMTTKSETQFTLMYGKGIYREQEILDIAIGAGIITPWEDMKMFLNIEGVKVKQNVAAEYLTNNPTVFDIINAKVRKIYDN